MVVIGTSYSDSWIQDIKLGTRIILIADVDKKVWSKVDSFILGVAILIKSNMATTRSRQLPAPLIKLITMTYPNHKDVSHFC